MVRDVFCKNCETKLGWMYVSVIMNFDNIYISNLYLINHCYKGLKIVICDNFFLLFFVFKM